MTELRDKSLVKPGCSVNKGGHKHGWALASNARNRTIPTLKSITPHFLLLHNNFMVA